MPVIGVLNSGSPGPSSALFMAAFSQGLSEAGYFEGQNLAIEYRWAEGHYDRLPALAADLVGRNVDLIIATSPPGAFAAKSATSTIPIVFRGGADPVGDGLVASLARPGGNLTGVSVLATEVTAKRLELLSELVPRAGVIALLVNPNSPSAERVIQEVEQAARAKGVQLSILKASTENEASELLAAFGIRVGIDDPAPFAFPSCEADNVLDYGMTWSEGPFNVPLGAEGPELQS
jgi:putative ABC transport system substrate-binding protein